jgi:hypothetical protein
MTAPSVPATTRLQHRYSAQSARDLMVASPHARLVDLILMYAIVDRFANVYPNLNQTYVAD